MLFKNYDQLICNGHNTEIQKKRKDILDMFIAAVDAVNPYRAVQQVIQDNHILCTNKSIDLSCFKNVYVVGFGKASIGMAQAVVDRIPTKNGVVITNDHTSLVVGGNVEVVVGGHPLPTTGSLVGANKILDVIKQSTEQDIVLVLISGGGSSLFCKPRVSLSDLQKTTQLLLESGADICELNTVRKHLSFVKGGQLLTQTKSRVVSLIISDIVGDPLEFIASGPTYPDSTTFQDAFAVFKRYNLWTRLPQQVKEVILKGSQGGVPETPKSNDPVFQKVDHLCVATNKMACEAVQHKAKKLGYQNILLSTSLTGEARYAGNMLLSQIKTYQKEKQQMVLISGGETTVAVTGQGKGGRNQELVLGCIKELAETDMVLASFATDGIDGKSPSAGAIADGLTFSRAKEKKLDQLQFLKDNNSYEFFSCLQDDLITGSTGTNVMDIQILVT